MTADLTKVLPAGRYVAHVTARAAGRTTRERFAFRLVGPNELPTARLQINALRPPSDDIDEDFDATVEVINRGTAPTRPQGTMTVSRMTGGPLARRNLRFDVLKPRRRATFSTTFPGLGEGQYRLSPGSRRRAAPTSAPSSSRRASRPRCSAGSSTGPPRTSRC